MVTAPKHDEFFWCKTCMMHSFYDLVEEDDDKLVYRCQDCGNRKERLKWPRKQNARKSNMSGEIAHAAVEQKGAMTATIAMEVAAGM